MRLRSPHGRAAAPDVRKVVASEADDCRGVKAAALWQLRRQAINDQPTRTGRRKSDARSTGA
jgi:hypothetical protein